MCLIVLRNIAENAAVPEWRTALPRLAGRRAVLREMRRSDARSLFTVLATANVSRFISQPPGSACGFERFIAWAARERAAGRYACFAVTPSGSDVAIGIFQVRSSDTSVATAEWGFALGEPFWGSGVFQDAAEQVVHFAFDTLGVHRLEARAAIENHRGNSALRKMGAVQEGLLRRSFLRDGERHDQALWGMLVSPSAVTAASSTRCSKCDSNQTRVIGQSTEKSFRRGRLALPLGYLRCQDCGHLSGRAFDPRLH